MIRLFSSLLAIALSISLASAHSGGLDASGGHHNRKTGEYHYHQKRTASRATSAPAPAPSASISPTLKETRINEYFRVANENVGALSCGLEIQNRDVPESVKEHIKRRDNYQCVICGSTTKLEVDHKRALMNGGSNDESNLAALCDDCHTDKTRMDNSLRRKRENICRN